MDLILESVNLPASGAKTVSKEPVTAQPAPSESSNSKQQQQTGPKSKKPRFSKQKGSKHGGTSYSKTSSRSGLQMVTRRRVFPVFTSNLGVRTVAAIIYDSMVGRDYRLGQTITLIQLQYVLCIAWCNRLCQIGQSEGTAFPLQASRLKSIASGIVLPDILCKFVECIGKVRTLSGVEVVPWVADYHQLFENDLMVSPADLLHEAERPIPRGDWALDVDWIIAYNDATTRAGRTGMKFRNVDNAALSGRPELLVSYSVVEEELIPWCPQVLLESEGQLGAAYQWRNRADIDRWPGTNKELVFNAFSTVPFDPRVFLTDIAVTAFSGARDA